VLEAAAQQEEGEVIVVTPQLLGSIATVGRSLIGLQGQLLVLEEALGSLPELVQRQVMAALRKLPQQPAPSVAEGLAAAACSAEVAPMQEQLAELRAQLTGWEQQSTQWQQELGAISGFMEQAGFPAGATGEQLQQALDKGSSAYIQVGELQKELAQLKRDAATSAGVYKLDYNSLTSQIKALQQQLEQGGAASREPRGQVMAWAPADMSPDAIATLVTTAAGLSSGCVVSVERRWVPPGTKGEEDGSSKGRDGAARSNGSNSGGMAAAAAAGPSSGAGGRARGKQQMALYSITLLAARFERTVLGGRTRQGLAYRQAPVWLEQTLTPEERQQRKNLTPVARQLRADGERTRWRGAVLEHLKQRGSQRQWVVVTIPPPPGSPSGRREETPAEGDRSAAAAAAGAAAGGGGTR
jgi:hypothetical protein